MKRSSHLRLALIATVPVALTGCDNPAINGDANQGWEAPAVAAAASTIDCSTTELMQTTACKAELERVLEESARYGSAEECKTNTGGECQQVTNNGQSAWMGPFTGFVGGMLLGNAIGSIGDYHRRGYRYGGYSGGYNGGYRQRVVYPANTPAPPPPTRAITQSRSGFGSTSAARRSFGG